MLRSLLILALLCVVGLTACDSTGEVTVEDGELIIGEWAVTNLTVDGENRMALLLTFYESVTIDFAETASFDITATPRDDSQSATSVRGEYVIDERNDTVAFTVLPAADDTPPQVASYEFDSETRLTLSLTTDGSLIEGVEGDAVVTLTKQSAE